MEQDNQKNNTTSFIYNAGCVAVAAGIAYGVLPPLLGTCAANIVPQGWSGLRWAAQGHAFAQAYNLAMRSAPVVTVALSGLIKYGLSAPVFVGGNLLSESFSREREVRTQPREDMKSLSTGRDCCSPSKGLSSVV